MKGKPTEAPAPLPEPAYPAQGEIAATEHNRRVIALWGVLAAGVLLLAGMVWRLVGQMSKGSS